MFELRFPNKRPIQLIPIDHAFASSPIVEFEAKQPRLKSNRFDVNAGDVGQLIEASATKFKSNLSFEETKHVGAERVFLTSHRTPSMHVRVLDAAFLDRNVQRNMYGRKDPIVKASRNRGFITLEFVGTEFNRWMGFLVVMGEKAKTNTAFVSFANRAIQKDDDEGILETIDENDDDD